MFLTYYGLRRQPFGVTPDPATLFLAASHREAFASLMYGIEARRGFMALIAPPGMGKTTLLFRLMDQIRTSARSAFLFQMQSSPREFLYNLAVDMGLECSGSYTLGDLQRRLNDALLEESRQGRRVVLALDEAQHLDHSILETVRMLSNFETTQAKLMQVILAGQPQLADRLASRELVQLNQRISVFARLDPLGSDEVAAYIDHRLRMAGGNGPGLFTRQAVKRIAESSGGIPRVINNLCFHALSLGYVKRQKTIDRSTVEEVIEDLNPAPRRQAASGSTGAPRQVGASRPYPGPSKQKPELEGEEHLIDSVTPRGWDQPASALLRPERGKRRDWLLAALALVIAIWVFDESLIKSPGGNGAPLKAALTLLLGRGSPSEGPRSPTQTTSSDARREKITNPDGSPSPREPGSGSSAADLAPLRSESLTPWNTRVSQGSAPSGPGYYDIDSEARRPLGKGATDDRPTHQSPSSLRPAADEPQGRRITNRGELLVTANVPGARILVNSTTKKDWFTPHTLYLPPGTYRVSISRIGYRSFEQIIDVKPGQATQVRGYLAVEDTSGSIIVETEPSGLPVVVDGKSYGPSPTFASLSPGRHELQVLPPSGQVKYVGLFELQPRTMLKKTIRWSGAPSGSPASSNTP